MYLKPTQALWKQVETKIDSMFEERIKYALNWYNYGMLKHEFDKACINWIIPADQDELVQKLGTRWFPIRDEITVTIPTGSGTTTYSLSAKTGGRTPYVSPHWNDYNDSNRPKVLDPKIMEISRLRHEANGKIVSERDAFKEEVKKIWYSAPSVNSLAKVWPPIIDLLPKEVVQQLEVKVKRRTAKELSDEVDTKTLSVRILKAKVAQ